MCVRGWASTDTSSKGDKIIWPDVTQHLREAIEDLLHDAQVDFYFCGHVHAYERTHRVYNSSVSTSGLVHVVSGAAGNIEGVSSWADGATPDWLAYRSRDFGWGKLQLHNSTAATWQYVRASDGSVLDEIQVTRESSH